MKKILIILAALIIAVVAFGSYVFSRINKETAGMKSLPTGEVVAGVLAVQDETVNMFLVENNGKYIAFDAGGSAENIQNGLQELQIDPQDIAAVFLTHTDYDHVAGVKLFSNAKVFISKAEEQMIDGTTTRMLVFKNKLEVPYTTLDDGQEVVVNGTVVKGILTKGHTPGSMSYQVATQFLFTGDLASLNEGKLAPFNEFFDMDTETSVSSQSRIAHLNGVEYIFTAHYGYTPFY